MNKEKSKRERFKTIQKSYFDDVIFEGSPPEFFEKSIDVLKKNKSLEEVKK